MTSLDREKKIFFGGTIITMNEAQPEVEAVGIVGEKIEAVGELDNIITKFENNYELIDIRGKTLLPGFIDGHLHPLGYLFFLLNPTFTNIKSLKECQTYLKDVSKTKSPDKLIIGFNLSEERFKNPILPTRWDLDEAVPDKPVFIMRYDGHIGIANSKGLEFAGITTDTPIPEGGEIRKNELGELTGVLSETATDLMLSKISFPSPKEFSSVATQGFYKLAEKGLTSLHGIYSSDQIPLLKSIQDKILQNWYSLIETTKPARLTKLKSSPLDEGNEGKFRVGGLKLFLDGTFGAKTACMFEPFEDAPEMCGFCIVEEEDIYEKMKIAHTNGFQIGIHVIGDKGNRIVVDLYKKLLKDHPREDHRHRIEHASMLTKDVIKDIKDLGLIASCQPPFINSEYNWLEKRIGKERCNYTYPFKSIVENGIILSAGSDCPVEDPDPILGLHAMVNRNGFIPEQCITMEEALKAYTINAAYAAFEENLKGSLEPGKLADLVILNKNPLTVHRDNIKDMQVVETIIRGKTVYRKE